ncbi:MAG: protein translocase subunit SecF [Kiloniella sp.]|nr:protein translocase subunit SecF [Kiloniella sp.]
MFPLIRLFPQNSNIDFLGLRRITLVLSLVLILGSVGMFLTRGLNLGIDFKGGLLFDLRFSETIAIDTVKEDLTALGFGTPEVQAFGSDRDAKVVFATPNAPTEDEEIAQVTAIKQAVRGLYPPKLDGEDLELAQAAATEGDIEFVNGSVEYRRVENVGSKISGELAQKGALATALALLAIAAYIWFRFEWQFAIAALLALSHDVITTIGLFSVFQFTFDLPTVAAILTIAGYSINDTVVVFDRAREEMRRYNERPVMEVLNIALNRTLSRTLMTSVTTLLALLALFAFGPLVIRDFTIALMWGVVIGTYSSLFFATPLLVVMGLSARAFDKKIVDDDEDDYAAQLAASVTQIDDDEIRARVRTDGGEDRPIEAEMIFPDDPDNDGPVQGGRRRVRKTKKKRPLGRK